MLYDREFTIEQEAIDYADEIMKDERYYTDRYYDTDHHVYVVEVWRS